MRIPTLAVLVLVLAGCSSPVQKPGKPDEGIIAEVNRSADERRQPPAADSKIQEALLPPLRIEMPAAPARAVETRFDLAVSSAPAAQVFMSIVSGTRYSMLIHPEVTGTLTVHLKDVTVHEALSAIRDLYGYDYQVDGTRIFVHPLTMQTRVFRVNYLVGQRLGRSEMRVTSGSVADSPPTIGGAQVTSPGFGTPAGSGIAGTGQQLPTITDSSRIQTNIRNDFWEEMRLTLQQMVGTEGGRSIVVNPQAGVIVVRAMPQELRQIDAYLRAIRASVERQVMLEAKIVEVTLMERYQTGINWAWFSSSAKAGNLVDPRTGGGMINPNTTLNPSGGAINSGNLNYNLTPGAASIAAGALPSLIPGVAAGSLFGLALQTANFSALLTFLESQGSVQVLSSPRIATLNNQKAVLKVGTDEFFITNVAGGTTTTSGVTTGGTTTFPTLTLRPFFSGVALDITPQIDEDSSIILHIHPSVSAVSQDDKEVNLGTVFGGAVTLPLARSTVSETDSIVRATDGNIVAIGGLMKVELAGDNSGLPGAKDLPTVGRLFGSDRRALVKKELVILIKPTVIQSDRDWTTDLQNSRERFNSMSIENARERFNRMSTGGQ